MTDQQRHAGRLRGLYQPTALGDIVGDRLLHQGRHARGDSQQTVGHMDLIGCRDDKAVRPILGQQPLENFEPCRAQPTGQVAAGGRGIDDRRELRHRLFQDTLDVTLADQAGAGDCELDPIGHGQCNVPIPTRIAKPIPPATASRHAHE